MDPCTAEHLGPVWPPYQRTGTAHQADLVKLGYLHTVESDVTPLNTGLQATAYHRAQNQHT